MFKNSAIVLAVLISTLTLTSPRLHAAFGGCSATGCGGVFSVSEFKDLLTEVIRSLRVAGGKQGFVVITGLDRISVSGPVVSIDLQVDVEALNDAVKSVSVVNNSLYIEGKPVDFRSDPKSGHIDFTLEEWNSHPSDQERMRMVIHELLMLASGRGHPEYNDYFYLEQLSARLLEIVLQNSLKFKMNQCAVALNDMARLDSTYTNLYTRCGQADPRGEFYPSWQGLARVIEEVYPAHVKNCEESCSFDQPSRTLCKSALVGACP